MAALLSLDLESDSEFGYDFSPEDEEALIQLASVNSHPATRRAPDIGTVIDSVPGKTESISGDKNAPLHAERNHTYAHGHRGPPSRDSAPTVCASRATAAQSAQPRSLPSPVSLHEDVAYPDCMLILWPNPLILTN